jgi:hypothetical protein
MINKSMFKKVIVSFLLAILFLTSFFVPFAKAQEGGNWYDPSFTEWSVKVFDDSNPNEIFGERYTFAQVVWIIYSLQAYPIKGDIVTCVNASATGDLTEIGKCIDGALTKKESASLGPVMGIAAVTDSVLSTQPASGVKYIADTAARLHIIPEAYAQGVGFKGLQPALQAWKLTRNMAYALSIIAIVILSFMIMFRVKISPQVVITVQSALPKIVIALILITFSYAIAGLIVDLAYLVLGFIATLIKSAGVELTSLTWLDFFTKFTFAPGLFWSLILSLLVFLVFWAFTGALLGGGVLAVTGGAGTIPVIAGAVIGGILFLILVIMMIIAALKILWLLVKSVINILLLIIAAPLMILFGTFSATAGFGSWLRSLIANVLVFPTVRIMLFLCHYFFWGLKTAEGSSGGLADMALFNPLKIIPFGGSETNLPGFLPFELGTGFLAWILTFGVFFITPKIGDMIKSMAEGKPFAYGTAIGEAFGPVGAVTGFAPVRAVREYGAQKTGAKVVKTVGVKTGIKSLEKLGDEMSKRLIK